MNAVVLNREDVRFLAVATVAVVAWACIATYLVSNTWIQGGLLLLIYLVVGEMRPDQQGDSR